MDEKLKETYSKILLEDLEKVLERNQSKIEEIVESTIKKYKTFANCAPRYRSESINEVASALAKAQSSICIAGMSKENDYFKKGYADLAEICRVSRGPLSSSGLAVSQCVQEDDTGMWLETLLIHTSGQFLSSRVRLKPIKNDIQSLGSYITYMKRYCLSALAGIFTGDEDDDGEAAVALSRDVVARGTALSSMYNPKEQPSETITKEQREEIEYELKGEDDLAYDFLNAYHLRNIADLPKKHFITVIRRIRERKQLRDGLRKD
jgi:hypothetical protein